MRSLNILPLLFLSTATLAQYTVVSNVYWEDYSNECEASCLTSIFNSQQCTLANTCNSNNCLTLDYSCLCGTASWLNATSQCIGKDCGVGPVSDAAAIASNECENAGVAMAISQGQIVQAGLAVAPSTTSVSSQTGAPSSRRSGSGGGLSTELQVIIGVVTSTVGLVVTIVGVFFAWKQYKHSKRQAHRAKSSSNLEAASSTTALTALPTAPARGIVSEEGQSQEGIAQPSPSPQAAAAALGRVDI